MSDVYPCPCRRSGQLTPITLTDAFGCDQCHKIFAVKPDGYTLEQLSTSYPYPPTWYWTGRHWHLAHAQSPMRCWYLLGGVLSFLLVLTLAWLFQSPLLFFVTLGLALIPAVIVWSALSRR